MADSKKQPKVDSDSEYEDIDLTDNPMYQVLSSLFENEKGDNIVEVLEKLIVAVKENTSVVRENKCKC